MNALRTTVVCAAVLGSVYVNEASQRNVTYYLNNVCRHYMPGSMPKENLPKNGKHLREKTGEWLREMSNIVGNWSGTETMREKCKTAGSTITVQGNTGLVGVMFFLEYMTTLTSNEDKKVSTMLFYNCSNNNRSVELWYDIRTPLCYLLYYNDSRGDNTKNTSIDLCSDAIQNTSISGVMESLAVFGKCLETTDLSQCTQKVKLFKDSWMSKTKRRRGEGGRGEDVGEARGERGQKEAERGTERRERKGEGRQAEKERKETKIKMIKNKIRKPH